MDTDVLVIGGGAAGLAAAARIRTHSPGTSVTLVSSTPFNTYRPWFMYALTGRLPVHDLHISLAQMAGRYGFTFRQATVEKLDPGSDTVIVDGEQIRYRRTIVALGAPTDHAAIPGAARYAVFPCDVSGFHEFRARLEALANGTVSIVLAGDRIGPGIEDAAWLARSYAATGAPEVRIRLLADDAAFAPIGRRATQRIAQKLEGWGGELLIGPSVQSIGRQQITLSDGRVLPSAVTAVVGPLRGPELQTSELTDQWGFFPVEPTLRSNVEPTVFVAGDAVARDASGLRRNWQLAVRQAHVAAENAVRSLDGARLVPFNEARDRRKARFYLPDVGGAAFLVWNRRLLTSGPLARRIRAAFDRKHFASYLPDDQRWLRRPA